MSRPVQIACVQFATRAVRGASDSQKIILEELEGVFRRLAGYRDQLVVFCEGVEAYAQTPETAENVQRGGPMLAAYRRLATAEGCHVAASMKTERGGKCFNSVVFLDPRGEVLGVYDKVNLTDGERNGGLSPGAGAVVVESALGRLGGLVCFDLNFQNVLDGYRRLKPDILAFPSMYHGGLMQQVFAYQTRAFFAAALPFDGGGILDPFGREVKVTDCYSPIARATVDLDRVMVHLDFNREKFPDIERKYGREVTVDIPANVGPALITSRSDKRSAADLVREFGLETLDAYLERSTAANDGKRGGTA
ncbi:MAG: carbon-nitrogen hydrolase family protein [Spirochaetes bacterium]|nr:carbon-nitrogen hydrolase family protein [Spirochaetota bacterium]